MEVETFILNNQVINSPVEKLKAGLYSFYNRQVATLLEKQIRRFRPDLIHVHNFFPRVSPAIFDVAARHGIPTVLTLHNYRLICANATLFRNGEVCEDCLPATLPWQGIRHACYRNSVSASATLTGTMLYHRWAKTWHNKVDRYIALTEFARRKFMSAPLKLPEEKISLKPNFVVDQGAGDYEMRHDSFLYIGRLSEEKGIKTLVEAFYHSDVQLQLIGTGPLEGWVQQVCREHVNIQHLGFLEQAAIADRLKKARALIVPSVWYEGFPMVIAEALAAGTPVICSAIGGLGEIIRNGENGLLVTPGVVSEIQDATALLDEDHSLHRQLCFNARNTYLENYTPEINYQSLKAIYESTIHQAHHEKTNEKANFKF